MNNGRRARGRVRAVILDWAGTAVDCGSRAAAGTFVGAFRRCGVRVTIQEARAPMGLGKRDHIRAMLSMPRVASAWRETHGRPATDEDVELLYAAFDPEAVAAVPGFAEPIPGVIEAVAALRGRGVRIGSCTGYGDAIMARVVPAARAAGYAPDVVVTVDHVPAGRPAPWMIHENARQLDVWPMASIVKVDDTPVGIEEGLNAGCWAVGVARTSSSVGLSLAEMAALGHDELAERVRIAYQELARAGAHLVIDTAADLADAVGTIEGRLSRGERP